MQSIARPVCQSISCSVFLSIIVNQCLPCASQLLPALCLSISAGPVPVNHCQSMPALCLSIIGSQCMLDACQSLLINVCLCPVKKQKHNVTHVEIWLGEGVKTIGARWQKGKVQIFDSYMFSATAYHSPTYVFKSIDTWLMGICRR